MDRRRFVIFNIIGALVWGVGVTLLGYWLGSKIPDVEKYILPVILAAMLISFGPTLYHLFKSPKLREKITSKFKRRDS
jgi:membrane-associated protein